MENYPTTLTWVFARGDDVLEIRRTASPDATRLVVEDPSGARTMDFPTHDALVRAHSTFEDQLASDGWRLRAFHPERRSRSAPAPVRVIERRRPRLVDR
jgi:hypothetical protein